MEIYIRAKYTTRDLESLVMEKHNAPGEGRGIPRTLDQIVGNLDSEATHD